MCVTIFNEFLERTGTQLHYKTYLNVGFPLYVKLLKLNYGRYTLTTR
jgi:hypothetical protein